MALYTYLDDRNANSNAPKGSYIALNNCLQLIEAASCVDNFSSLEIFKIVLNLIFIRTVFWAILKEIAKCKLLTAASLSRMPLPQPSTSERQHESGTELSVDEKVVFSQSLYS